MNIGNDTYLPTWDSTKSSLGLASATEIHGSSKNISLIQCHIVQIMPALEGDLQEWQTQEVNVTQGEWQTQEVNVRLG